MGHNRCWVIQKYFVDDERQIMLAAQAGEFPPLPRLGEVAGWVVGMNQDDGARLGRDGAAESLRVDLPAVVVDQRRGLEADVVEGGEEVEQRIARLRNQDFVPGSQSRRNRKL